jgi:hypothetical protein
MRDPIRRFLTRHALSPGRFVSWRELTGLALAAAALYVISVREPGALRHSLDEAAVLVNAE